MTTCLRKAAWRRSRFSWLMVWRDTVPHGREFMTGGAWGGRSHCNIVHQKREMNVHPGFPFFFTLESSQCAGAKFRVVLPSWIESLWEDTLRGMCSMWFLVQTSWQWRLTYHSYPATLWFECENLTIGSGVWTLALQQADGGILEVYGIFWRRSPTGGNEPLGTGPTPLPVSSLLPDCRYCVTTYSSLPLHDGLHWQTSLP